MAISNSSRKEKGFSFHLLGQQNKLATAAFFLWKGTQAKEQQQGYVAGLDKGYVPPTCLLAPHAARSLVKHFISAQMCIFWE